MDGRIWLRPEGTQYFCRDLSEQEQKLVWVTQGVPNPDLFEAKVVGTAEATHGFLDPPLVVEVRHARLLVRRPDRCINVGFNAGLARQSRETLALCLFPLDARVLPVLYAEYPHVPINVRRKVTSSSRSPSMLSTP